MTTDRLDEIEARLTQNAVPDPHHQDTDCRECSDARDLTVLVAFARTVDAAEIKWRTGRGQDDVRFRMEVLAARRALKQP